MRKEIQELLAQYEKLNEKVKAAEVVLSLLKEERLTAFKAWGKSKHKFNRDRARKKREKEQQHE